MKFNSKFKCRIRLVHWLRFNSQSKLKPFSTYLLHASYGQGIVLNNTIAWHTPDRSRLIDPFTKDLIIKRKVHPPVMGICYFASPRGKRWKPWRKDKPELMTSWIYGEWRWRAKKKKESKVKGWERLGDHWWDQDDNLSSIYV